MSIDVEAAWAGDFVDTSFFTDIWLRRTQSKMEGKGMCVACGCDEPGRSRRIIMPADPAHPRPDELVLIAVEEALARAERWLGWNGAATMSMGSVWTPHKALRRVTDHLIDHLAQIESRAAGVADVGDEWHGRMVTVATDWAPFTEQDLDEASARLRRLGHVIALRLRALEPHWDATAGSEWTIRAIAEHVVEGTATYASKPPQTSIA